MIPLWLAPTLAMQALASADEQRRRSLLGLGPSQWGLLALEAARDDLGRGEQGRNNAGPYLDLIRDGGPGGAWCAAAVSHWLLRGWVQLHRGGACPVRRSHGARRLWRRVVAAGAQVDEPRPGDCALWARGREGSWQGHVAIVSCVEGLGSALRWWVVEGNVGRYPAVVTEREVTDRPRLIGWARLP